MKHKFYTAFCLLLLLLAAGCAKKADLDLPNTVADQFRNEDQTIQLYLAANNISAQRDISGLYFKIVSYGNGTRYIGPENIPSVIYTNRLLNGRTVAVSYGPTNFDGRALKDHLRGWQIGLPKISQGGKILLIIPSPLAYGTQRIDNIIPANAIIVSEIELVDFK